MVIPDILKGEIHLPLKPHMRAQEAIELCNMFYMTSLNPQDFGDTQVSTNAQGVYQLELITLSDNQTVINFFNKTMNPVVKDITVNNLNPIAKALNSVPWINAPLVVQYRQELSFLETMGVGDVASPNVSYELATLLTSYKLLGRWVSGTLGELCTGNFVLVSKAAQGNPNFVIKLVAGNKQGYLCLKV